MLRAEPACCAWGRGSACSFPDVPGGGAARPGAAATPVAAYLQNGDICFMLGADMKNVYTVVGRPYAVTTSAACTVSTPDGVLIASCEPGYQVIFVAPCDVVLVSEDDAHVTATFSSAASAVSGGGMKRELEEDIEQTRSALAEDIRQTESALERSIGQHADEAAAALEAHAQTSLHLQPEERDKWNSPIPVGTIIPSACSSVAGYLLCNGAAVERSTYAALFAAIGTTFGAGNGSTTFNLPDLRGRTLWGANTAAPLGQVLQAGLPEIQGQFTAYGYAAGGPSGVFSVTTVSKSVLTYGSGENTNSNHYNFKASRSNSIYGGSSTVQPPAVAINYFIKC